MKKIINYFLQGLLYIVPITATGAFVVWSFKKIDGILPFDFPGLGLIIIITLITLVCNIKYFDNAQKFQF